MLYGVSEELVDESYVDEADIPHDHLISLVPKPVNKETKEEYRRLSRSSSKPRPLSLSFASDKEEHVFLERAQTLRQAGISCVDFLTRLQRFSFPLLGIFSQVHSSSG